MLVLSDRMEVVGEPVLGTCSVTKAASVPESVSVSKVDDGRALTVRHGSVSILITLSKDEAAIIASALVAQEAA